MSDISYSSSVLPAIPGKANYPTSGKTSDYVLTQADVSGFKTFTNEGVAADTYTKLLLHMDDAGLTDVTGKTVTLGGSAARSSVQSVFGGYSASFNGTSGSQISLPDSDDWNFGTGDFTIDFWVRFNAFTFDDAMLYNQDDMGANYIQCWYRNSSSTLFFQGISTNPAISCSPGFSLNTWYHVAIVRSNTSSWYVFINGVSKTLSVVRGTSSMPDISSTLRLGSDVRNNTWLNGYFDEYRVSKGIARWTSNFTPPSSPYTVSTGQVTFTLPSAAPGMSVCFLNKAGKDMLINASSGDNFSIVGYETPTLTSIKSTAAGEKINLTALDSTTWYSTKNTSGWGTTYMFQGTSYGFASGGHTGTYSSVIDKISFASTSNGVSHGNLTYAALHFGSGNSSTTHGFVTGGHNGNPLNSIDKFLFSSNTTASSWGNLSVIRHGGASSSSSTQGFFASGQNTTIEKFNFASSGTAVSHGSIPTTNWVPAGHSLSDVRGYHSSGTTGVIMFLSIIKYDFASNTTASNHGDLVVARHTMSGQSSDSYGFTSGGNVSAGGLVATAAMDRFAFSSNTTATSWGVLSLAKLATSGQSHTSKGFASGGYVSSPLAGIDQFNYASNTTATNWGSLTVARESTAGAQI